MSDVKDHYSGHGGQAAAIHMFRDNGDGTYSEAIASYTWGWDVTDLAWKKLLVDHTTGNLMVSAAGGGGGGGPVTIADGADVAQGTTTDPSTSSTVVGILKAIKTAVQGTLTVGGSVSVSNFPATQPVSGTFWQATQPVSGTFWQATQPVSGTVAATQGTSPWVVQDTLLESAVGSPTVNPLSAYTVLEELNEIRKLSVKSLAIAQAAIPKPRVVSYSTLLHRS